MREDELALGEGLAESCGESGHPGLGSTVALVHGIQVLVVDVDAVELVGGDELRERVGRANGVGALRSGLVRLAKGRDDDVDTGRGVLRLLRSTDVRRKRCEGTGLVEGALKGKEGEGDDVEALQGVRVRCVEQHM